MRRLPRIGRFETQVRLALILLAVFLGVLNLANLWLLVRARGALESAERESARARAREAVLALGAEKIVSPNDPPDEASLRRIALRLDLTGIAILDTQGRVRAQEGTRFETPGSGRSLSPTTLEALEAGRTIAETGDGVTAFVPVLRPDGVLAGIVEARHGAPALAALDRSIRVLIAVQIAGVGLIAVLALALARWVSLPYRRLAQAAGEAGLTPLAGRSGPDPEDLAEAFRAVTGKLREQERAIGNVEREGGGLGDLVRFAQGPGREMATGVVVVDRRCRVVAANPTALGLLESTAKEAHGTPLSAVVNGIDGLATLVSRCVETGTGASREVLEVRRVGEVVGHLGVAVSPAAGYGGEVAGALVLVSDLTEIRRVQQQVRTRENLAAVGKVAAGIAHEVRNALGTILGYARLLEKGPDPRARGPAKEILKEVHAVRVALDGFLAYAKPPEPRPERLDLVEVVRACAAAAPANLEVDLDGEFGEVFADESLLRRAFGNLLLNAAEAAESLGRSVRVRIVGRRVGASSLLVDLEDDGPGIPEEIRETLFLPFVTGRSRGTGLGLALVQRTMLDLGGSVEARSGRQGGALFRLRFPVPGKPGGTVKGPRPSQSM